MSSQAVVDASLVVKWLLREPGSDSARDLVARWTESGTQPMAPRLLIYEVANVLLRRVRRDQLSLNQALRTFTNLLELGIELVDDAQVHKRAIEIATYVNQGAVYDAHYLALAERLNCECWTADLAFHRATAGITNRVRVLESQ